ncbi:MAG: LysM peptidoglycan-binding domain-containing protein [Gammaproteobacteria bacterium]|nr:LysM peptidoglycan-binding domain-containing protein [Gammaproteobacteria bacterium]
MRNKLAGGVKASLFVAMAVTLGACATTPKQETAPPTQTPAATAPAASSAPQSQPAPAPSGVVSSYEVNRGDCLWTIAGQSQIYGNPYEWPLIYKANSAEIKHGPDLIFPGQTFSIERGASSAQVDRAMHYAKTRGAWKLGVEGSADRAYLAGQ